MTLTRFTPFSSALSDVAVLQNRLNSIFNDFARPESGSESLSMGSFLPPVDVYEDEHKVVLKLEVPGIPKESLSLNVEGRTLTVKGERRFETQEKEENFQRIERRYGSFTRSFTLPATVDTENVTAVTADGVLTIQLAKKAEAKPRQIEVKAAPAADAPKQVEANTK